MNLADVAPPDDSGVPLILYGLLALLVAGSVTLLMLMRRRHRDRRG